METISIFQRQLDAIRNAGLRQSTYLPNVAIDFRDRLVVHSRGAEIHGFLQRPEGLVEGQVAHLVLGFVDFVLAKRLVDSDESDGSAGDRVEEQLEI